MHILVIAAVDFELDVARRVWRGDNVTFLRGGVGADQTRQALEPLLAAGTFDRVLDIGIAGAYGPELPLGAVVHVTAERHADGDGVLLHNPAPWPELAFLPTATGNTLQVLEDRFRSLPADVESMEGAAFFEACLQSGTSFAEVRAVSNLVGEKDHAMWDIPLALKNLQQALETLKNVLK